MGLVSLKKQRAETFLPLMTMWVCTEKMAICKPGRKLPPGMFCSVEVSCHIWGHSPALRRGSHGAEQSLPTHNQHQFTSHVHEILHLWSSFWMTAVQPTSDCNLRKDLGYPLLNPWSNNKRLFSFYVSEFWGDLFCSTYWYLDFGLPRNKRNKCRLFKTASSWYFTIATKGHSNAAT